jgi:hypothetical protein
MVSQGKINVENQHLAKLARSPSQPGKEHLRDSYQALKAHGFQTRLMLHPTPLYPSPIKVILSHVNQALSDLNKQL